MKNAARFLSTFFCFIALPALADRFALDCRFVSILCEPKYGCSYPPKDSTGVFLVVDTDAKSLLFKESGEATYSSSYKGFIAQDQIEGEFRNQNNVRVIVGVDRMSGNARIYYDGGNPGYYEKDVACAKAATPPQARF